jgi:hypothetical protein
MMDMTVQAGDIRAHYREVNTACRFARTTHGTIPTSRVLHVPAGSECGSFMKRDDEKVSRLVRQLPWNRKK